MANKEWISMLYSEREERIAALEKRNDKLEASIGALKEFIHFKMLYHDCVHKKGANLCFRELHFDENNRCTCNAADCPVLKNHNNI